MRSLLHPMLSAQLDPVERAGLLNNRPSILVPIVPIPVHNLITAHHHSLTVTILVG
jgi:hypothetical protein